MINRVMIVEDDESAREMMDAVLSQAGFQVATAASGEAALELLHRSRFSLVLLDVHMPRIDGLAVLAAMRALRRKPPVLMVSADTQSDVIRRAIDLGCVGYLAKPFAPKDLIQRARKAMAGATGAIGTVPLTLH
jgi:DNA-binding response OmpR family regulator